MNDHRPTKPRKNRGHRISLRELVVGVCVAVAGYALEVIAISHHPDVRVFLSHILEPVLVAIILALMAGFSWPAMWAFFRNSLKALRAILTTLLVASGTAMLVLGLFEREPLAIVVGAVIAGVVCVFVVSFVLAIRSLGGNFGVPEPVPDENLPFVSWTWGVPIPDLSGMPGIGPAEDPEWEEGWKHAFDEAPHDNESEPREQ